MPGPIFVIPFHSSRGLMRPFKCKFNSCNITSLFSHFGDLKNMSEQIEFAVVKLFYLGQLNLDEEKGEKKD